jgi:5-methylthioadenosine/S-adenosylhomocysteine deaminase
MTLLPHPVKESLQEIERHAGVSSANGLFAMLKAKNNIVHRPASGMFSNEPASNGNLSISEVPVYLRSFIKLQQEMRTKEKLRKLFQIPANTDKFLKEPLEQFRRGYIADFILIKKNSLRLNPQTNIFANILYSISEEDVATIIVDGKTVLKNGKLLTIDVGEVIKEANKILQRFVKWTFDKPMQTFG